MKVGDKVTLKFCKEEMLLAHEMKNKTVLTIVEIKKDDMGTRARLEPVYMENWRYLDCLTLISRGDG